MQWLYDIFLNCLMLYSVTWFTPSFAASVSNHQYIVQTQRSIHGDRPHQEIAKSLNNLGALCIDEGDLRGARRHYEEALEMVFWFLFLFMLIILLAVVLVLVLVVLLRTR